MKYVYFVTYSSIEKGGTAIGNIDIVCKKKIKGIRDIRGIEEAITHKGHSSVVVKGFSLLREMNK